MQDPAEYNVFVICQRQIFIFYKTKYKNILHLQNGDFLNFTLHKKKKKKYVSSVEHGNFCQIEIVDQDDTNCKM